MTEETFRALMHATFNLVGKAMGQPTKNTRAWLALMTGNFDLVYWPPNNTGSRKMVPHSMSDMTLAELEVFWEDARRVIAFEVLPHVAPAMAEEIRRRIGIDDTVTLDSSPR